MCAIFGYSGIEQVGLLDEMATRSRHRGPNGGGEFRAAGFAMGMCRLAVLDIAGGTQPIENEDGSLVLCCNGEIYNYKELRSELQGRGHHFKSNGDIEVIVHAYEEWGKDCLHRFDGMFALALFDRVSGTTFFARDRVGEKPFYFWKDDGGKHFIFASEIKALLACHHVPRQLNTGALDPFLALRYTPEPATLFSGIQTLPSGHWMERSAGGNTTVERYWHGPARRGDTIPLSPEEAADALEDLLTKSVKRRLRSDVPLGTYLSSGVDSSLITAIARNESPNPLKTFAIGFGSTVDETEDAAKTAAFLGTEHHTIECSPGDLSLLPEVIWHMDRPIGDALIVAFYKLAQAASKEVTVILGGEGADELFGGYPFHHTLPLAEKLKMFTPLIGRSIRACPLSVLDRFFSFPAGLGTAGRALVAEFFSGYQRRDLTGNEAALRTVWTGSERQALYTSAFAEEISANAENHSFPASSAGVHPEDSFHDQMLRLGFDGWLQDWALIRQDKNTMAHGLELRLPFFDPMVMDLAYRTGIDSRRNKDAVRRVAARHLPPQVSQRKKIPFFFPVEQFWNHAMVKEIVADTLSPEVVKRRGYFNPRVISDLREKSISGGFLSSKKMMALVVFELWHRTFLDGDGSRPG